MTGNIVARFAIHGLFVACLMPNSVFATGRESPVPLVDPPAGARTWSITSSAGKHGEAHVWTAADGAIWGRENMMLRGMSWNLQQTVRLTPEGHVLTWNARGVSPPGPFEDHFERMTNRAEWRTSIDNGESSDIEAIYSPVAGFIDFSAVLASTVLAKQLLSAPNHISRLLPSGCASLEKLAETTVRVGTETKVLDAYAIFGLAWAPRVVWLEKDGNLFARVGVIRQVLKGWESVTGQLAVLQAQALARRTPGQVKRISRRPTGAVVFEDVKLYDAIARRFLPHMSVMVKDGLIAGVGSTDSLSVPPGAERIPGTGRTLVPGLWDNHQHVIDDERALLLLSQGITTVRDLGNIESELRARIQRIESGRMLGPRILPYLMIDGDSPFSEQTAVLVSTLPQALRQVQRAHAEGYVGVKLYGSLDPRFVKPIAEEAHRLGLRVQGHIPAGMRPLEAVRNGYQEITHIYFLFMQGMPDDVVRQSNTTQRFSGPARYAGDLDFSKNPMRDFFSELSRRRIAFDPTLTIWGRGIGAERGQVIPSLAAFAESLPPQVYRAALVAKTVVGPARDRSRASFRKALEAVRELHRRGVPILAGTDGEGLDLVYELELYVEAGLSTADALASATIVPAKVMGQDHRTGAITVGKEADLLLVQGDPESRIGDLRNVEHVMRGGFHMKGEDLRMAVGLRARAPSLTAISPNSASGCER